MRWMRDDQLPEPYRSWIDRGQPLPADVRLLPRAVRVVHDTLFFILSVVMVVQVAVLVYVLFWEQLVVGRWEPILFLIVAFTLLALIPIYSLRRFCITLGAHRDVKRGTLRQGILVGPEGILVRTEPNDCYPIALEQFATARIYHPGYQRKSVHTRFVIDTVEEPMAVYFYYKRLLDPPEVLNRVVGKMQKRQKRKRPAGHS